MNEATAGVQVERKIIPWWRWLFGTALFTSLVLLAGPETLLRIFSEAQLSLIPALFAMACIWLLASAINVWLLLRTLTDVRLSRFIGIYVTSWSIGLITPGQLGDASQILLLRTDGVDMERSSAAYTIDKAMSFVLFILVGSYAVYRYTSTEGALAAGFLTVGSLCLLIISWSAITRIATWRWLLRLRDFIDKVGQQVMVFRKRPAPVIINGLLTIGKWLIMAFMYWLAFRIVGVVIPIEAAATIPVVSSLVAYVPISVAGLGTMETTAVALFSKLGVSGAAVVSAYVLLRVVLIATAGTMLLFRAGRKYAHTH